ncbi:flavin-containing monooxygenase [Variovorax saccharolyticus]|uniref:flavin-containing monooxygenase n=1 Tax=Variovorax saccharolyticus TaxID=3053516 RepID=UPI002577082A|nr:NAD(P)-binding domain-containing protein [Variovorax sp. J22R187]MDM0021027.1 NAD(P)-binding domain-containing protein [Variovorax sp. J22R187]
MERPVRDAPQPAVAGHARPGEVLDLLIIGAGIGGVMALYYARKAGLSALVLERQDVVGGLWATLPAWQDIQFGRCDWTLGDLPIAGEDQASIRDNIQAWVDRFGLAGSIRLGTEVRRATRSGELWIVETAAGTFRARHLISATGAHNRPFVPEPARESVELRELHSSQLRDAADLAGRDVVVVGGGASAYDLLDLCFEYQARRVIWVYRNARWMMPTRKPKKVAGSPRELARAQMEGATLEEISRGLQAKLVDRYAKFGLEAIRPEGQFDLGRDQLLPGRHRMIENFSKIERHRAEVSRIRGRRAELSTGEAVEADLLLWATGYQVDLGFFANESLSRITGHDELCAQCGCGLRAIAEPGLYFLAAGLESTGTAPWSYALLARTLMSHVQGQATLEPVPLARKLNHFHYPAFLAERDPVNFPQGHWQDEYQRLAFAHPQDLPLPIPD